MSMCESVRKCVSARVCICLSRLACTCQSVSIYIFIDPWVLFVFFCVLCVCMRVRETSKTFTHEKGNIHLKI